MCRPAPGATMTVPVAEVERWTMTGPCEAEGTLRMYGFAVVTVTVALIPLIVKGVETVTSTVREILLMVKGVAQTTLTVALMLLTMTGAAALLIWTMPRTMTVAEMLLTMPMFAAPAARTTEGVLE